MVTFPNAKINLGLNVVERRPDGYHNLETIFYPIRLEDVLEVTTMDESEKQYSENGYKLHISGAPIIGSSEDNLVVKAYRLLSAEFPIPYINIYMHKQIPMGAGLGGGSSDAAYMLKLLRELYNLPLTDDDLEELATRLGADCAFFVRNRPTFASGIGNIFSPISLSLAGYYLLLVKPDIFVSTRDAFSLIRPHKPAVSLTEIVARPVEEWRTIGMGNDFEESVFSKHPTIGDIKRELYEMNALYAAMSGSGSSLFGIFATQPDEEECARRFSSCFWRILNLE